jgi:8-oxo-dGTP diphosphatase
MPVHPIKGNDHSISGEKEQMKIIHTVGLAYIQDGKLLLVRKKQTTRFIVPGGKREANEPEIDSLEREVWEELHCHINLPTLQFLGEYTDRAANEPNALVAMKLYTGNLLGVPQPSSEIEEFQWIDVFHHGAFPLADLVKHKILPHVIQVINDEKEAEGCKERSGDNRTEAK